MNQPEQDYREAVRNLEQAQARVGALPKGDPEREAAKLAFERAAARVRETKEALKEATTQRNFAGLTSPAFIACAELLDADTLARIEERALRLQTERNEAAAARRAEKAAKQTAAPVAPPHELAEPPGPARRMTGTQRAQVEVVHRRGAP